MPRTATHNLSEVCHARVSSSCPGRSALHLTSRRTRLQQVVNQHVHVVLDDGDGLADPHAAARRDGRSQQAGGYFAGNCRRIPAVTKYLNPDAIASVSKGLVNEIAKASGMAAPNPGADMTGAVGERTRRERDERGHGSLASAADAGEGSRRVEGEPDGLDGSDFEERPGAVTSPR